MRKLLTIGTLLAVLAAPSFAMTEEELELEKQKLELERQKLDLERERMKLEEEKKSSSGTTNNIYVNGNSQPAPAPMYQMPAKPRNETKTSMYVSFNSFGGSGTRSYEVDNTSVYSDDTYDISGSYIAIGFGRPDETRFEIGSGSRTLDFVGGSLEGTSLDLNWIFTGGSYRSSQATNGMGYFKFGFGVVTYDYASDTDFDSAFAVRLGFGYIVNMNESFEINFGYDLEVASASVVYNENTAYETTATISDTSGLLNIGIALRF